MTNSNEYMRQYMANRRKNRREKLIQMSGAKCERCGSTQDLEFNHKDRLDKIDSLSGAFLDKPWKVIQAEWLKCELLCGKCHREYTDDQFANGEIIVWNSKKDEPYIHGTVRTYQELKCKCDSCKQAKRLYRMKLIRYDDDPV